jgi:hypothetical protein
MNGNSKMSQWMVLVGEAFEKNRKKRHVDGTRNNDISYVWRFVASVAISCDCASFHRF